MEPFGQPPANSSSPGISRRRHERFAVEKPGVLRIPEMRGGIFLVTVLDVSKSGLRVNCPKIISNDTRVEVRCQGAKIFGAVRYARRVGIDQFNLGVQVDSVEIRGFVSHEEEFDLTVLFRIAARRAASTRL